MKKNRKNRFWGTLLAVILTASMIIPKCASVSAQNLPLTTTETSDTELCSESMDFVEQGEVSAGQTEQNEEPAMEPNEEPAIEPNEEPVMEPNEEPSNPVEQDEESDDNKEDIDNTDHDEEIEAEAVSKTKNIVGDVFANMINDSLFKDSPDGNGTQVKNLDQYPLEHHEREWYGDSLRVRDLSNGNYLVYRDSYLLFSEAESSNYEVLWSEDNSTAYISPVIPQDKLEGTSGIVFLSNDVGTDIVIVFDGVAEYDDDTMAIPVMDTSLITVNQLFSDGHLGTSYAAEKNTADGVRRNVAAVDGPVIPTVDWNTNPSGTNWSGRLENYDVGDFDCGLDYNVYALDFELYVRFGVFSDFYITTSGPTGGKEKVTIASISIPVEVINLHVIYNMCVEFDDEPISVSGRMETKLDYALGINGANIHNFKTPVDLYDIQLINGSDANKDINFYIGSTIECSGNFLEITIETPLFDITIGPVLKLVQISGGGRNFYTRLCKDEYITPDFSKESVHICTQNGKAGCWKIHWEEIQTEDIDFIINLFFKEVTFSIHSTEQVIAEGDYYYSLTYDHSLYEGICPYLYYNVPVAVWKDNIGGRQPLAGMTVEANNPGEKAPEMGKGTTDANGKTTLFLPYHEAYKYEISASGVVGGVTLAGSAYQQTDMVKGQNDTVNIIIRPDAKVDVQVTKAWDIDIDGKDVPSSINVKLQKSVGSQTTWDDVDTYELKSDDDEDKNWKKKITDLPKYQIDGTGNYDIINYRIVELNQAGNVVLDGGAVDYSIPDYETSQGDYVAAHKTRYVAKYTITQKEGGEGENSFIDTTITNTAIYEIDVNKKWDPSSMEKPNKLYLTLLYAPADGWERKAKEEGITSEWIPVISPKGGQTNTLKQLIKDRILKTSTVGMVGNVALAISKTDTTLSWKTSYTVNKYRDGIPMQYKGAELDSQIIENLLKYEYNIEQTAEVISFGDYISIPGMAHKMDEDYHLSAEVINTNGKAIGGSIIWHDSTAPKPAYVTIRIFDSKKTEIASLRVYDQSSDTWSWIYKSDNLDPDAQYTIKEEIPTVTGGVWVPEIKGLNAHNYWSTANHSILKIRAVFEVGVTDTPDSIGIDVFDESGQVKWTDSLAKVGYTWEKTSNSGVEDFSKYSFKETSGVEEFIPIYQDVRITIEENGGYKVPCYTFIVVNRSQRNLNVTINVAWNNGGASDIGTLPEAVTVDVYRDKELVNTVKVVANGWTIMIDKDSAGNPLYRSSPDGHLYNYTVKERRVEGYETSNKKAASLGAITFTITNTRRAKYHVTVKGIVNWKGDEGKESYRPETVHLDIINSYDEIVSSVDVPTNGDGTWKVENLAGTDEKGKEIRYHVRENYVKAYSTIYDEPKYNKNLRTYTCDLTNELTGYFTFKIEKKIQGEPGPDDKDETFVFNVKAYDGVYETEDSKNGKRKVTKDIPKPISPVLTIKGEGVATESVIIDEPGLYTYVITENKGDKKYVYDDTVRYIIISMFRDSTGRPEYKSWVGQAKSDVASDSFRTIIKEYEEDIARQDNKDIPIVESDVVTFINKAIQTITYDLNGGKYHGSKKNIVEEHVSGDIIKIHKAPKRKGYTFLYWQGSKYSPGDTYQVKGNHTFTAKWKKNDEPGNNPQNDNQNNKEDVAAPRAENAEQPGNAVEVVRGRDTGDVSDLSSRMVILLISIIAICCLTGTRKKQSQSAKPHL